MDIEKFNKASELKKQIDYLESDKAFLQSVVFQNRLVSPIEILVSNPHLGRCLVYPELLDQILRMLMEQNEILSQKLKKEFEEL